MAAQYRQTQLMGWTPLQPASLVTFQNNAAATWVAYSFITDVARIINNVRAYISAVAGTVAASDVTATLYDSTGTSGVPGSAIEGPVNCGTTITGANWYNWSGFTTSLTAGQMYYIVFKNSNGTPASNNVTFRIVSNSQLIGVASGTVAQRIAWAAGTSTNSGTTYSVSNNRSTIRIGYADGYDGIPLSNTAVAGSGDGVYSTRESGLKFTSPLNTVLRVAGISLFLGAKTGTPTGSARYGLWTGATPVNQGYTNSLPNGSVYTAVTYLPAYFSSPIIILPSTVVRITLAETTQSDTVSNYFALHEISCDTDSNSVILLPWDGTATKTYFDGSNWTDSALGTSLFGHALLLDTAQEFAGVPIGHITGARSIGTY